MEHSYTDSKATRLSRCWRKTRSDRNPCHSISIPFGVLFVLQPGTSLLPPTTPSLLLALLRPPRWPIISIDQTPEHATERKKPQDCCNTFP